MAGTNGSGTRTLDNLPETLIAQKKELLAAMIQDKDPREWNKEDRILRAYAPAAIGKILIATHHPLLERRAIAYLWRESISGHGKTLLGRASVASGKVKFFAKVDFLIDFNWKAWQLLKPRDRVALVDHELTHCITDGDDQTPQIVPHDVEEFGSIVQRWGLWQPDLKRFAEAMQNSQFSLFETVGANG